MDDLASRIIFYRAKHKMTQEQFAKKCGMSHVTIIRMERGEPVTRITQARVELVLNRDKE